MQPAIFDLSGLHPHAADARHDVVINVVTVSGERLEPQDRGLRYQPFRKVCHTPDVPKRCSTPASGCP